jgi:hypothetical protein
MFRPPASIHNREILLRGYRSLLLPVAETLCRRRECPEPLKPHLPGKTTDAFRIAGIEEKAHV